MKGLIIPAIIAETQRNLQAFTISTIKATRPVPFHVHVNIGGRVVRRSIRSVPTGQQLELNL